MSKCVYFKCAYLTMLLIPDIKEIFKEVFSSIEKFYLCIHKMKDYPIQTDRQR